MDRFEGVFDILFAHQPSTIRVDLEGAIVDAYGHPLYLLAVNGTIYNWLNVIIMKKVEGN